MRFHAAGKVALEHLYTAADPRAYFTTLRGLEYQIPELAKPYFAGLVDELRPHPLGDPVTIVDIGCSYGINAALLRHGLTMDELYRHYCALPADLTRDAVLARDRALFAARPRAELRFVGLDVATVALAYGLDAGLLDDAVAADLEGNDPTPAQRRVLSRADLVVSTGCVGYVTERTIARVVEAAAGPLPVLAHTVLRMYPFDRAVDRLDQLGYETVAVDRMLRQRRFASAEEQSHVLDTLSELGVDPRGLESDGWFYARLFISRPRGSATGFPRQE